MLGNHKPTNTMKVALWTKERAEQTQGGLKSWGLEFWGLPLPTAGINRALSVTHVWFPGEKMRLAEPESQQSTGPSQRRGNGLESRKTSCRQPLECRCHHHCNWAAFLSPN